ncbi:MAG: hypothetical protein SOX32_13195 [Candidatus Choladocola sp.]|nr:hypothetical protein [Candidatus Choladocola sp.]
MPFKDKLIFLMQITQTSNKDLAEGISVDPSLISLLRSGKRKKPHDKERIRQIALFFAGRCTADYQRNALAEMLGITVLKSALPVKAVAGHLERWLQGDIDAVDQFVESFSQTPIDPEPFFSAEPAPVLKGETTFYYGKDGLRESTRCISKMIMDSVSPCSVYLSMGNDLDWLLSDYLLAKELQTNALKTLRRGFTFHQILPSISNTNRYTESLSFWLPMYSTGNMKIYYYPRLRDNMLRYSSILVPDHFIQASFGMGSNCETTVTLVSTDPELVHCYTEQFQQYLALCHEALIVHRDTEEFFPCFQDIFSRKGDTIQMVSPLSVNTLPEQMLGQCIHKAENPKWKNTFQMYLKELPHFEKRLEMGPYIDMCYLASAKEIRSETVPIASVFKTSELHPCYTPETYILHLKNILRLMDEYPNYYFLPYNEKPHPEYNLIVNEDGLALMIRTHAPVIMMEFRRPEIVLALREYLLRIAEKQGYDGIHKTKIRSRLKALIEELQR